MKKSIKIWLIIATVLILLGSSIFTVAMAKNGWNFSKLSTIKYVTNEVSLSEPFNNIYVETTTADVKIVKSQEGSKAVFLEQENLRHNAVVDNNTLKISATDTRKWYDHIGISFKAPKVTLYLTETDYQSLQVKTATGDVEVSKDFSFTTVDVLGETGDVKIIGGATESVKIKVSTGDVFVKDVNSKSLEISTSTGDVEVLNSFISNDVLINVSTGDVEIDSLISNKSITVKSTTGDVEFERIDAPDIFIKTSTGDVEGSIKTGKIFNAKSNTGKVRVPSSTTGGTFVIETDTGDITVIVSNN